MTATPTDTTTTPKPAPLPPGWAWTTLGDVMEVVSKKIDPGLTTEARYIGLEHISKGTGQILRFGHSSEVNSTKTAFEANDVLYGKLRPYLNKVVLAPSPGICSTDILALRSAIHPPFLKYRLLSQEFVTYASTNVNGVQHPRIDAKTLAVFNLALPPLPEQRRIVTRIEELFSKLDAGVAGLKRTQVLLKRYRQSLLHAAVTGELSREWRAQHGAGNTDAETAEQLLQRILTERREKWRASGKAGKYKEPQGPNVEGLPELPEGWTWARVDQLAWDAGYGTSVKCSYENEGPPVLRIPNVVRGELLIDDLKFAPPSATLREEEAVQPHDLLLIRTNGSKDLIGRAAVVRQQLSTATFFASYLIRFRLLGDMTLLRWVATAWASHFVRRWMDVNAASSAGQHNISMGKISGLALPLPPLAEQEFIVAEVERRLSVLDKLEATVTAELKRAEATRQSVLHQAFTGQLVAQDPADEPASVLLERIQAERVSAGAAGIRTRQTRRRRSGPQEPLLTTEE